MNDKVLLTAFQPFGIKGAITGKNISQQVCDELAKMHSSRVNYVRLSVDPKGEFELATALASQPKAALLCGEDLSMLGSDVRIEPKAYNPEQQVNLTIPHLLPWGVLSLRWRGAASLSSGFAEQAIAATGGRRVALQEGIGTFWCNRLYYRALEWGKLHERPTLFVHLGVLGQFHEKLTAVHAILDLMLKYRSFNKQAAADFARSNAASSHEEAKRRGGGQTWCAKHVRLAIEAGGIHLKPVEFARDYGKSLLAAGFQVISPGGYSPSMADVIVFQPVSTSRAGHMQIYDGAQWVSDFKQKDRLWPNSDPRSVWQIERPLHKIYRYP